MGRSSRRIVRVLGAGGIAAALVWGMGLPAAVAEPAPPAGSEPVGAADGALSGRLEQLSALPISSDPVVGAEQVQAAASDLSVAPDGGGSLQIDADARVAVTVRYSTGPSEADVAALEALGPVSASSARFRMASASVAPADLAAVAALPGVISVEESLAPFVGGAAAPAAVPAAPRADSDEAPADAATAGAASCRTVTANLAVPLDADLAAADFGVNGTGVKVGVISDSFATKPDARTTPEQDVLDGVLPGAGNPCGFTTPVEVVREAPVAATDEGRAMAQLVHSIAPGAELAFANAGQSELDFSTAIDLLVASGAEVIVDDITMFSDPFFQDGPIGIAIKDAEAAGVTYLSAAGNFTVLGASGHPSAGLPISSWETTAYRPAECRDDVRLELEDQGYTAFDCLDFDPSSEVDTVDEMTFTATPEHAAATFSMHWAEPVGAVAGAFHFALINPDGSIDVTPAAAAGTPNVTGSIGTVDGDYGFVVIRDTSAAGSEITPALKVILAAHPYLQAVEYYESGEEDTVGSTITGHAGAPQTVSVAAAAYDTPTKVESYSSGGPSIHYFDYDPDAAPVATPFATPQVTAKPDVTSVDGGFTNFFGQKVSTGTYAFYGTSAASPAAAGVVALGVQLRPEATVAQIRAALGDTATPLDSPVPSVFAPENIVGAGLVDAPEFLAALPVPVPAPTPAPVPVPDPQPVPAADGAPKLAATGAAVPGAGLAFAALALLAGLVAALGARGLRRV